MDIDCPKCSYWRIPAYKDMCSRCQRDKEYNSKEDIQVKEMELGA